MNQYDLTDDNYIPVLIGPPSSRPADTTKEAARRVVARHQAKLSSRDTGGDDHISQRTTLPFKSYDHGRPKSFREDGVLWEIYGADPDLSVRCEDPAFVICGSCQTKDAVLKIASEERSLGHRELHLKCPKCGGIYTAVEERGNAHKL